MEKQQEGPCIQCRSLTLQLKKKINQHLAPGRFSHSPYLPRVSDFSVQYQYPAVKEGEIH